MREVASIPITNLKFDDGRVKHTGTPIVMPTEAIYDMFINEGLISCNYKHEGAFYTLTEDKFRDIFYTAGGDLSWYISVVNHTMQYIYPLELRLGSNITYSEKQNKTLNFVPKDKMVVVGAKALRSCRNEYLTPINRNITFMIGNIYRGVGYLVYDAHFKGKRLGLSVKQGESQSDVFALEFTNILMGVTNFKQCMSVVSPMNANRGIVKKLLLEIGFRLN